MSDKTPSCFTCTCKDCAILKNCNKELLEIINKEKKILRLRSGQMIISEGSNLSDIYFIYKGKVKIVSAGLFGKNQIKRLAKKGDFVGYRGLQQKHTITASIYALEDDTTLCTVNIDLFTAVLKSHPEFMFETMMYIMDEFTKVENRMKNLALMNVREKTAEALLFIYNSYGNTKSGELEVLLTRQEMAEIAMTTKEQISKCLAEFHGDHIIELTGKKIFIRNLSSLKRIIGI